MARKSPEPPPRRRAPRPPPAPPPPPPQEAVGEVVPPTEGPPAPTRVTWIDWYNGKATGDQQAAFDRAASVIDNGGTPYQKGGTYENYVENWRSQGPDFYAALVNYRDTGGRRALFAVPAKDYGPRPISVVQKGGPIEPLTAGTLVLHPGRYSYTDVAANGPAFENWLKITTPKSVTTGQVQVSPSVSGLGKPYYTDVEFLVSSDTPWPDMVGGDKLVGTPTWLPKGINIVDYWGQVTTSHPDWLAPLRGLEQAADLAKSIGTLAAVVAVAYVLSTLRERH